jgi:DNA-binding transcriptional ArsR family regulator
MKEILEELFNSKTRAKVLKLLFRNPDSAFNVSEIAKRIKVDYYAVRREMQKLKNLKIVCLRQRAFLLNPKFQFYQELKNLVLRSTPISNDKILKKLKKVGRMKLIVLSGVFANFENSRVDLFLVGNNVSMRRLENFLKELEAEVGKEIDYVVMDADEFNYRRGMFDKFVLEVLEGPKVVLLDKIGIA